MSIVTVDGQLASCTLSTGLEERLPAHVVKEYPAFVQFLRAYYEWLEQDGNAYHAAANLGNTIDVDRTADSFLQFFRETYLYNIPVDLFGVDRDERELFTVDEDFGSALTYQCLCEGTSVRYFVDPSATVEIDSYPIDFIRTSNWMVSVLNESTGERQSFHLLATQDGTNAYDTIYSQIGPSIAYTVEAVIESGRLKIKLTNAESDRLVVDIIRAPTFEASEGIGPRRNYLLGREVNDLTRVRVFVNGNELQESQFTISGNIGFCGNIFRELIIDETVILAVGDEVEVTYREKRNVDERLLIKNIQQLLSSKGTEESYRLLFRLLFNEEIQIEYPGNNILRWSDGKWEDNRQSIRVTANNDLTPLLYRRVEIVEYDEVAQEDKVVGSFVVQEVFNQNVVNYDLVDLFIGDIEGNLKTSSDLVYVNGEYRPKVRLQAQFTDVGGTQYDIKESVVPTLNDIDITDGGSQYSIGSFITMNDAKDYTIQFTGVDGVQTVPLGLSANLAEGDIEVDLNGGTLTYGSANDYYVDGSDLIFTSALSDGDNVVVKLLTKGAYITIKETDGSGAIQAIEIYDSGFGYQDTSTVDVSNTTGTQATVSSVTGALTAYEGRYINTDGHLSSIPVIQDGLKNQDFAYVIKSERTLDEYAEVLKRVVHPIGFKMFGEINIKSCISLVIQGFQYLITKKPFSVLSSNSAFGQPKLGPRYRSFDENKLRFPIWRDREPNTQVQTIYNELVDYFVNYPDESLHYLLDSFFTITGVNTITGISGPADETETVDTSPVTESKTADYTSGTDLVKQAYTVGQTGDIPSTVKSYQFTLATETTVRVVQQGEIDYDNVANANLTTTWTGPDTDTSTLDKTGSGDPLTIDSTDIITLDAGTYQVDFAFDSDNTEAANGIGIQVTELETEYTNGDTIILNSDTTFVGDDFLNALSINSSPVDEDDFELVVFGSNVRGLRIKSNASTTYTVNYADTLDITVQRKRYDLSSITMLADDINRVTNVVDWEDYYQLNTVTNQLVLKQEYTATTLVDVLSRTTYPVAQNIENGDSITITGSVSGSIALIEADYSENRIAFDADAGGEDITVTIVINN